VGFIKIKESSYSFFLFSFSSFLLKNVDRLPPLNFKNFKNLQKIKIKRIEEIVAKIKISKL